VRAVFTPFAYRFLRLSLPVHDGCGTVLLNAIREMDWVGLLIFRLNRVSEMLLLMT
jgi:hypothetical protein